jgi:beta-galactosidase
MKPVRLVSLFLVLLSAAASHAGERTSLDLGWKFHLGNSADPGEDFGYGAGTIFAKSGEGVGPSRSGFDDSSWRTVNVPHDWAVELPFVMDGTGPIEHGSKPLGGRYPDTSIGWYRQTFNLPQTSSPKRYRIDFDGVYRDCRVWVNGHSIGEHQSGYSGFSYDISDWVNVGGRNVIAVRVDATQNEGWFYEGAGIYRHVSLVTSEPVHISRYGVYAIPTVVGVDGRLKIYVAIQNDGDKIAHVEPNFILAGGGVTTGTDSDPATTSVTIPPHSSAVAMKVMHVPNVALWSIEKPNLYTLTATVGDPRNGGGAVDSQTTSIGFRTIKFDKDKGFFLNGVHVEIKGTCNHQDHAGVGSAVPDAINWYRVKLLKQMGSNAYRTSHNDPTPSVLDACDHLGMVVMDEHRLMDSNPDTLEQLQELVRRDRNHPCVIMWSIGNEEPIQGTDIGHRIAQTMMRTIHSLDTTRPLSCAASNGNGYQGVNELLDLRGWNYFVLGDPDKYHADHPDQPMFGSEEASTLSTRGIYTNDPYKGYVSAFDVNKPGWGSLAEQWWKYYMARPFLAGAFVWTGFDYRGEPTPYSWPCISSHFGIMDTCGFPKDNYYYYQAQWTTDPVVHVLPHWTWPGQQGKPVEVWVQTNCDEVELFVNGKSVGRSKVEQYGHAVFKTTYEPGTLEARGYKNGQVVKVDTVKTAGTAARLLLTPDRTTMTADGEDAEVFNVMALDSQNNPVPIADNKLDFDIEGPGRIIGVGNGNPSDHDPDTFISTPQGFAISDWTMAPAPFDAKPGDTLDIKPTGDARRTNVRRGPEQIRAENSAALFTASFTLTADQMTAGMNQLTLGGVDDEGWVYINGKLAAHTSDWSASFKVDVARYLKQGDNTITVYVKNVGGRGGLGNGVALIGPDVQPKFSRRLFNGLAQVIVRTGTMPGSIRVSVHSEGLEPANATVTTTAK